MHGVDIVGLEKNDGPSGPAGAEMQECGTAGSLGTVGPLVDLEPQHVAIKRRAADGIGHRERAADRRDDCRPHFHFFASHASTEKLPGPKISTITDANK